MIQNVCIMQMMLSYVIKDVADSRKIPTRHFGHDVMQRLYIFTKLTSIYIMIFSIFKYIYIYSDLINLYISIHREMYVYIYIVLLLLKKILHHVKHKKNLFDQ